VFTACRTVNGRVFRLEDHLERLFDSAAGIHMKPPLPVERLRELVQEIVEKNMRISQGGDLLLEIVFSGGLIGDTMKQSGKGAHLYVAVQPLVVPPAELYETGVVLATFPHQRMWAQVKLLNYVGAIIGHQTVVPEHDAYEVLFVDPSDSQTILEGSTFTIFFVDSKDVVVTPPLDGRILDSVTRRVVLEILAAGSPAPVVEEPVRMDQLSELRESFIVSTTRSVLPVRAIDDTKIGDGRPGPVTHSIMQAFSDYMENY
jgi:branched-subunit amino acid aminotransferase/4-amino-4-deoxychorismate lyase